MNYCIIFLRFRNDVLVKYSMKFNMIIKDSKITKEILMKKLNLTSEELTIRLKEYYQLNQD